MSDLKPYRIEETLDLLIGYTGNTHIDAVTYDRFLKRWAERLDKGSRFGVILVYEEHDHDHVDNHDSRDAAEEDRMTRAISNFRRIYRERVSQVCTGFSRVFPASWLEGMSDEDMRKYEVRSNRLAAYMFGIKGKNFTSLDKAKQWLSSIASDAPLDLGIELGRDTESSIGFYYGSTTGMTEMIAEKMRVLAVKVGIILKPVNISDLRNPQELLQHQKLILGIPTWNIGQLQDDWIILFPKLDELDFTGKQVALFGVGDQKGYPDNFLDALGTLGHKLLERGTELIGYWPADGYEFAHSKALVDGKFMGLGVDEYNQEDQTDMRIINWLQQIQKEFNKTLLSTAIVSSFE